MQILILLRWGLHSTGFDDFLSWQTSHQLFWMDSFSRPTWKRWNLCMGFFVVALENSVVKCYFILFYCFCQVLWWIGFSSLAELFFDFDLPWYFCHLFLEFAFCFGFSSLSHTFEFYVIRIAISPPVSIFCEIRFFRRSRVACFSPYIVLNLFWS